MALKRDYDEKIQYLRDEYQLKLDKSYHDWKSLQDEVSVGHQKLASAQEEYQRQLFDLQNKYNNQLNEKESQIQVLINEVSIKKNDFVILDSKLLEREEEIQRLNKLISEKNNKIVSLEEQLIKLQNEVNRFKEDMKNINLSGAEKDQNYKILLSTKEIEVKKLREDILKLQEKLNQIETLKLKSEQSLLANEIELKQIISSLEIERLNLINEYDEYKISANNARDEASKELALLCQRIQNREETMLQERNEMERNHSMNFNQLKLKLEQEIFDLKNSYENLNSSSKLRENELLTKIQQIQNSSSSSMEEIEMKYQNINKELELKLKSEYDTLSKSWDDLQQKYNNLLQESQTNQKSSMENIKKNENQIFNLNSELETKKREMVALNENNSKYKDLLENLHQEMKNKDLFYQQQMSKNSSSLLIEAQKRLDEQIELDRLALIQAIQDTKKQNELEIIQIKNSYNDEINGLKKLLQEEVNKTSDAMALLEQDKLKLENQLQLTIKNHEKELIQLNTTMKEKEKLFDEEKKVALDKLRHEMIGSNKSLEKDIEEKYLKDISLLKVSFEKRQEELNDNNKKNLAVAISTTSKEWEESSNRRCNELELRLTKQFQQQLNDKEEFYKSLNIDQQVAFQREKNLLHDQISELLKSIGVSNQQCEQLQLSFNQSQDMNENLKLSHQTEMENIISKYENLVDEKIQFYDNEIMTIKNQANYDFNNLKEEYLEEKNNLIQKYQEMEKLYESLQQKYKNRESRSDDLQRIAILEQEISAKDELLLKTREEMQFFKREMLNREENYNRKFNSNPIVGVMQVIKPKNDIDNMSIGSKPMIGKSATKPTPLTTSTSKVGYLPHPVSGPSPSARKF